MWDGRGKKRRRGREERELSSTARKERTKEAEEVSFSVGIHSENF